MAKPNNSFINSIKIVHYQVFSRKTVPPWCTTIFHFYHGVGGYPPYIYAGLSVSVRAVIIIIGITDAAARRVHTRG